MKKRLTIFICFVFSATVFSQKMMTRSGEIKFEATMPSFEQIAAKNTTASCVFDKATSEIAVLVLVKAFRFKIPLMEEHFNENYIESDQFPKSTFKGKVIDFDASKLKSSKTSFGLEGDLTLNGVTKKIKTQIYFVQSGEKLITTSTFKIKLMDYNVKIPLLVKSKIAETAVIDLKFDLEKKL